EQHLRQAAHLRPAEAAHLVEVELGPHTREQAPLRARAVGGRGDVRAVDRADAAAGDDVEARLAADPLTDVTQDTDLVGAPRPAARQHEADLGPLPAHADAPRREGPRALSA